MAAPGSQMKRCPTCGAINVTSAQVCSACGHRFKTQIGDVPITGPTTAIATPDPGGEAQATAPASPDVIDADFKDKTPRRVPTWLVATVVLVALMSFCWFMAQREKAASERAMTLKFGSFEQKAALVPGYATKAEVSKVLGTPIRSGRARIPPRLVDDFVRWLGERGTPKPQLLNSMMVVVEAYEYDDGYVFFDDGAVVMYLAKGNSPLIEVF